MLPAICDSFKDEINVLADLSLSRECVGIEIHPVITSNKNDAVLEEFRKKFEVLESVMRDGKALDSQLLEKNCYIKELEEKLSHIDKNTDKSENSSEVGNQTGRPQIKIENSNIRNAVQTSLGLCHKNQAKDEKAVCVIDLINDQVSSTPLQRMEFPSFSREERDNVVG